MQMEKQINYTAEDHTFVICAYKESPYLKKNIQSLLRQSVKSRIIMATSTPNRFIEEIAGQFSIPLYVNDAESGIATDWNFAYARANTALVTISHQDDIYDSGYLESILKALNSVKRPILAHTAYYEIRNGARVYSNRLLRIKKLMLMPLIPKVMWNSVFWRRRSLSLGCAICCPSVTYVKDRLPEEPFETGCRAALDWQAWERYSRLKGAFCYISRPMMGHRVHEESETSNVIGKENGRTPEDYTMYRRFWPKFIADRLIKFYEKGQSSNQL